MKIEVLGTGCAKCDKLMELIRQAAVELGVDAEISKVAKLDEIMKHGVMMTPALVIDGTVKCSGKLPSVEQIKEWLEKD